MEATSLNALSRDKKGKGYNRRLREKGQVPAVIYGKGKEDVPIIIDEKELRGILSRETGRNTIIKLEIARKDQPEEHTVMIRDIQQDPLKGQLVHADFYEIALNQKIHTKVPLVFTGDSPGLRKGGILQQLLREVEMECLASAIPEQLEVDISQLDLGCRITVADLKCVEGCKISTNEETVVATIIAPRMAEGEAEADEPKPTGEAV
ncbi:MAG: 50S ribosomal protein L25/general stress protein Ctc [Clostridia bacterium]|nr:50S ribosomal protein L25/general stress protein Ctc [Clostridia bacterium]